MSAEYYQLRPGWTKEAVKARLRERVPPWGAYDPDCEKCVYRVDGTHPASGTCAAGAFLPDELYQPRFEALPIDVVVGLCPELADHLPLAVNGMTALQDYHDELAEDGEPDVLDQLFDWVDECTTEDPRLTRADCEGVSR